MAAEQYIIVHHDCEWMIIFNYKYYGPFDSQEDAVEAAIDAAYAMGGIGIDAQVLVKDAKHQLNTEWAYPQDFTTSMR